MAKSSSSGKDGGKGGGKDGSKGGSSSSSSSSGDGKPPAKPYKFIPNDVYQKTRLEGGSKSEKAKDAASASPSSTIVSGSPSTASTAAAETSATGFQVKTSNQSGASLQSIPITLKTIEVEYHPVMPAAQQEEKEVGRKASCDVCKKEFSSQNELRAHQRKGQCPGEQKGVSDSLPLPELAPGSHDFAPGLLSFESLPKEVQDLLTGKFDFEAAEVLFKRITNFNGGSREEDRCSSIYLLVAPFLAEQSKIKILPNKPFNLDKMILFLSSAVYAGKCGGLIRPYTHRQCSQNKKKRETLKAIYDTGELFQVVVLCQNLSDTQARTLEKCIIFLLRGRTNLTNDRCDNIAHSLKLSPKEMNSVATYLIYKFYIAYVNDDSPRRYLFQPALATTDNSATEATPAPKGTKRKLELDADDENMPGSSSDAEQQVPKRQTTPDSASMAEAEQQSLVATSAATGEEEKEEKFAPTLPARRSYKYDNPPIIFRDVDGAAALLKVEEMVATMLNPQQQEYLNELGTYLQSEASVWTIDEEHIELIVYLLSGGDGKFAPNVTLLTLEVLQAAALKEDAQEALILHQDQKDHRLMSYINRIESLTLAEQEEIVKLLCNLCAGPSTFDWLLYISEWAEANGQGASNSRVTVRAAVHTLLNKQLTTLQRNGIYLIYNLSLRGVFEDVAIELSTAVLQYLHGDVPEDQALLCLTVISRFIAISTTDVPALIKMLGPNLGKYKGKNGDIDKLIEEIEAKLPPFD